MHMHCILMVVALYDTYCSGLVHMYLFWGGFLFFFFFSFFSFSGGHLPFLFLQLFNWHVHVHGAGVHYLIWIQPTIHQFSMIHIIALKASASPIYQKY